VCFLLTESVSFGGRKSYENEGEKKKINLRKWLCHCFVTNLVYIVYLFAAGEEPLDI
jgi:hypothetical protein